ncbi:MAG: chemotaxis protein CheW [Terriglobia bacterium]
MKGRQQFSTFFVDHLFFGVEVGNVQEVLRYQEMTRVPLAPPVVRGLINLRGQIVTAIDLRCRLGLSEPPPGHQPLNVVIRVDGGTVSLLVDETGDVVEVDSGTFERPPETLSGEARELISGVHKLQGRLMHVLDAAKVVSQETASEVNHGKAERCDR